MKNKPRNTKKEQRREATMKETKAKIMMKWTMGTKQMMMKKGDTQGRCAVVKIPAKMKSREKRSLTVALLRLYHWQGNSPREKTEVKG